MSIRCSPACVVALEVSRAHVAATRLPQNSETEWIDDIGITTRLPQNPETEWIDDIGIDFDEQRGENNNIDSDEQVQECAHHVVIVAVCSSALALCC